MPDAATVMLSHPCSVERMLREYTQSMDDITPLLGSIDITGQLVSVPSAPCSCAPSSHYCEFIFALNCTNVPLAIYSSS